LWAGYGRIQRILVSKMIVKESSKKTTIEAIKLYIAYAVPAEEQTRAVSLVLKYEGDRSVLALLREYYSTLPEAREEALIRIAALTQRQSVLLLVAMTEKRAYLYAVSGEEVVFLGDYGDEVDSQILSHFGFNSQEDFLKVCLDVHELQEYKGHDLEISPLCSACGVAEGEVHLLGCTVEVCPWCNGQLSNCNCRFEQLGVEEVESESELDQFYDLLTEKGQIPFKREQNPSYPASGNGLDKKGEK